MHRGGETKRFLYILDVYMYIMYILYIYLHVYIYIYHNLYGADMMHGARLRGARNRTALRRSVARCSESFGCSTLCSAASPPARQSRGDGFGRSEDSKYRCVVKISFRKHAFSKKEQIIAKQ